MLQQRTGDRSKDGLVDGVCVRVDKLVQVVLGDRRHKVRRRQGYAVARNLDGTDDSEQLGHRVIVDRDHGVDMHAETWTCELGTLLCVRWEVGIEVRVDEAPANTGEELLELRRRGNVAGFALTWSWVGERVAVSAAYQAERSMIRLQQAVCSDKAAAWPQLSGIHLLEENGPCAISSERLVEHRHKFLELVQRVEHLRDLAFPMDERRALRVRQDAEVDTFRVGQRPAQLGLDRRYVGDHKAEHREERLAPLAARSLDDRSIKRRQAKAGRRQVDSHRRYGVDGRSPRTHRLTDRREAL